MPCRTSGDPCPLLIEFKISVDAGNLLSCQIRCNKFDILLFSKCPVLFSAIATIGDEDCLFFLYFHGGKMFLRSDCREVKFPDQVTARAATAEDLEEIKRYVSEYCRLFVGDEDAIMSSPFNVVTPDSKNPYKQMYVAN